MDIGRRDVQFLPAPAVIGDLAIAMLEQALEALPLQRLNSFRAQPLIVLIVIEVGQRTSPAQTTLIGRIQRLAERRFIPAAHGNSLPGHSKIVMSCATARQPEQIMRRCFPPPPVPNATRYQKAASRADPDVVVLRLCSSRSPSRQTDTARSCSFGSGRTRHRTVRTVKAAASTPWRARRATMPLARGQLRPACGVPQPPPSRSCSRQRPATTESL